MRKRSRFAVLGNLFAFHLVRDAIFLQRGLDRFDVIRKQVQIDIRTGANMTGEYTADEAGSEAGKPLHHPQCRDSHVLESDRASIAFVHAGERLHDLANLRIARQVAGFDGAATKPAGSFLLGGEILGLRPVVHEPGGLDRNCAAELGIGHGICAVDLFDEPIHCHREARGGNDSRKRDKYELRLDL